MARKLEDSVAVITGAASGIGLATAYPLANRSAALVLAGRQGEALEAVASSRGDRSGPHPDNRFVSRHGIYIVTPYRASRPAAASRQGRAHTFIGAIAIIIFWGVTDSVFGWSDAWQLIINTGTTIVTFLMVFLIQNTQNRDTQALHLKLDKLIRVIEGVGDSLMNLEDRSEDQLDATKAELKQAIHHRNNSARKITSAARMVRRSKSASAHRRVAQHRRSANQLVMHKPPFVQIGLSSVA